MTFAVYSQEVREAIAIALLDFNTKAREFQISQEIAIRESQRFQGRLAKGITSAAISHFLIFHS